MIDWVFGLARMLGLGAAAGTRPWLTLALVGVMSQLGWGVPLNGAFDWLGNRWVLLVLAVLAILEAAFDKIVRVDRLQDRMVFPLRLAAGAVAGAATIDAGWPGLAAGLAAGGFAAWLAEHVKHVRRPRATRSEATIPLLSLIEDLYAFLGTVGTLVWSPVGFVVVAWPAALWVEMRRRRKAKYAALRRRRDPREPPGAATGAPPSAAPDVAPTACRRRPRGARSRRLQRRRSPCRMRWRRRPHRPCRRLPCRRRTRHREPHPTAWSREARRHPASTGRRRREPAWRHPRRRPAADGRGADRRARAAR